MMIKCYVLSFFNIFITQNPYYIWVSKSLYILDKKQRDLLAGSDKAAEFKMSIIVGSKSNRIKIKFILLYFSLLKNMFSLDSFVLRNVILNLKGALLSVFYIYFTQPHK